MSIHVPVDPSNDQLLAELNRFASSEKRATAQLVAHLAELDARGFYAGLGFSPLFTYACEVLHLSEHEAYNRIEAARLARKFPVVLDLLGEGRVNLTTAAQTEGCGSALAPQPRGSEPCRARSGRGELQLRGKERPALW